MLISLLYTNDAAHTDRSNHVVSIFYYGSKCLLFLSHLAIDNQLSYNNVLICIPNQNTVESVWAYLYPSGRYDAGLVVYTGRFHSQKQKNTCQQNIVHKILKKQAWIGVHVTDIVDRTC